jgi:excisionase family DNA binding protein
MAPAEKKSLTIGVVEAGRRYLGIGRDASYAAVHDGLIPVIRVGRLLRVPVRAMEALLDQAAHRADREPPA